MRVYKIDCDGVIYHVTGENKEEAIQHLVDRQIEWNGCLDTELDKWIVSERTDPFKIHCIDEDVDFMSTDLITNRPDVLCCSEW